jgi:hypothetical protein
MYNGIVSGHKPIDSYFASMKSMSQVEPTATNPNAVRICVQPVPLNFLEPSVAWVFDVDTKKEGYRMLEQFGSQVSLTSLIERDGQ